MRAILTALVLAALAPAAAAQDVEVTTPTAPGVSSAGSGVCVASRDGRSIVLTCEHVFGPGPFPRPAEVRHGGKTYRAACVGACGDTDVAVVVVHATLPAAQLADADARAGEAVTHNGRKSGPAAGVVLPYRTEYVEAKAHFAATLPSISGDSGAAVYDAAGKVVSLVCGRTGVGAGDPMRGAPLSAIKRAVARVAPDATDFPTNHGPDELPKAPAQAVPATVRVEQTVVGADGKLFTRVVERPAGYAPMVSQPMPVQQYAPRFVPAQFGPAPSCAGGRCGR
jgi:hypothetical protein